jgi:hypothetical protein
MSTPANAAYTQGDPGDESSQYSISAPSANGSAPVRGSFLHNMVSGLGRAFQILSAPETRKALLGLSIVGNQNSPGAEIAMQQINEIDRQNYEQAQLAAQQRIQDSELQSQALQRQRLQQEMGAFQTPEQKQAMELDTQNKLLQLQRQNAEPTLMPLPNANGGIDYLQRKYNPATGDYDITPAMVSRLIPNPTQAQVAHPLPSNAYGPEQPPTRLFFHLSPAI